jgi:hypothetical protein
MKEEQQGMLQCSTKQATQEYINIAIPFTCKSRIHKLSAD